MQIKQALKKLIMLYILWLPVMNMEQVDSDFTIIDEDLQDSLLLMGVDIHELDKYAALIYEEGIKGEDYVQSAFSAIADNIVELWAIEQGGMLICCVAKFGGGCAAS